MSAKDFALENEGKRFRVATDYCRNVAVNGREITVRVVGYLHSEWLVVEISEGDVKFFSKKDAIWTREMLKDNEAFKSVADEVTNCAVLISSTYLGQLMPMSQSSDFEMGSMNQDEPEPDEDAPSEAE